MRLLIFCVPVLAGLFFCNCRHKHVAINAPLTQANLSGKKPLRMGMVTGIRPEKIAYYKELHANTWKGVLKKIEECNIRNYSIYLKKIDDKYYLFSYYEYIGDNYEKDMKKIAVDTISQRWWRETDPCQQPLPEAAVAGKIWTPMEEVFHTR
ncbi:MAG: L-rhamnose mutarotase [Bacteroidota bacterium]